MCVLKNSLRQGRTCPRGYWGNPRWAEGFGLVQYRPISITNISSRIFCASQNTHFHLLYYFNLFELWYREYRVSWYYWQFFTCLPVCDWVWRHWPARHQNVNPLKVELQSSGRNGRDVSRKVHQSIHLENHWWHNLLFGYVRSTPLHRHTQ